MHTTVQLLRGTLLWQVSPKSLLCMPAAVESGYIYYVYNRVFHIMCTLVSSNQVTAIVELDVIVNTLHASYAVQQSQHARC